MPGFGKIRIEVLGRRIPLEVLGTITNITQGAIHVRLDEFLRGGPVRVWFSDDCHSDGQLLLCRVIDGAYQAGIPERVLVPLQSARVRRLVRAHHHESCDRNALRYKALIGKTDEPVS